MPETQTLKVKCGPNGNCPREGFARRAFDSLGKEISCISVDDGVVEVPDTRFYRRRIAAGDLVEVAAEEPPAPPAEVAAEPAPEPEAVPEPIPAPEPTLAAEPETTTSESPRKRRKE